MKYLLLWACVVIRTSTMKPRGMSHDSFSSCIQPIALLTFEAVIAVTVFVS